jgi:hypothetical protein
MSKVEEDKDKKSVDVRKEDKDKKSVDARKDERTEKELKRNIEYHSSKEYERAFNFISVFCEINNIEFEEEDIIPYGCEDSEFRSKKEEAKLNYVPDVLWTYNINEKEVEVRPVEVSTCVIKPWDMYLKKWKVDLCGRDRETKEYADTDLWIIYLMDRNFSKVSPKT